MKIYIYGYGQIGKRLAKTLLDNELLIGIIDNDNLLHGTEIYGRKIINLEEYSIIRQCEEIVVVSVSLQYQEELGESLKRIGLIHGKDYYYHDEFLHGILPSLMLEQKNKSFVPIVQISLTERCTLKCKKCAHACYAVANDAEDLSLMEVYRSADSFFSKVDYIQEFVLIGGEPLLFKEMAQVIEYIGYKYREKINVFSIITNGTITPNEDVLKMCKNYRVLVRISNYTKTLPNLKQLHDRLIAALNIYGISYVLGKIDSEWMDYGFEYVNRDCSKEELQEVFSACKTSCREIRGNRYYYCVMARAVSENLGMGVGKEDYLDLDKLSHDNYKRELLDFNLGYSEKGYLDMCRYCHGKEAKNHQIPVAEQMK